MSNEPLTDAQIETLRRGSHQDPAELAHATGLTRNRVTEELARIEASLPVWKGREPRWTLFLGGLLILLMGAFAYSGNIGSGLHFDDAHTVLERDNVPLLSKHMAENVREDDRVGRKIGELRRGTVKTLESIFRWNPFRVVTYFSFAVQHYFNDGSLQGPADASDPFALKAAPGLHRVNDFIHLLNGALAMWVAFLTFTAPAFRRSLNANRYPVLSALLVGALFTLHPLQTQAVTYMSQRAESLAATFFLLALGLHITARERRARSDAGSAPWLTLLVWSAAGVLAGVFLVLARWESLPFGAFLLLLFGLVVAAIAASVGLVKRGFDERGHALAISGCFLAFGLGLETKEIVATLPLAIVAWELFFGREAKSSGEAPSLRGPWIVRACKRLVGERERARHLAPWLALVLLALCGVLALGGRKITTQMAGTEVKLGGHQEVPLTPAIYLLTQANVVHTYVRLAVAPVGQSLDHDYPLALAPEVKADLSSPATSSPLTTLLSLAGLVGVLVLALVYGGRARAPAFGALLMLTVLAPSSSVIVLSDVIYEHRFYLPMFGLALALVAMGERALRLAPDALRARLLGAALLLVVVVCATLTRERNRVWVDGIRLWKDVTEKGPNKPRGWLNLGLEIQNRETHLVVMADGTPEYWSARPLPRLQSEPERILLVKVSRLQQAGRVVFGNEVQGIVQAPAGKPGYEPWTQERARALYDKVFAIEPYYAKALNNLALIATYERHNLQLEDQVLREMIKNETIRQNPGSAALIQACRTRIEQNMEREQVLSDEALDCFETQLKRGMTGFHLFNNVGNLHSLRRNYPGADAYLTRALLYDEAPIEVWAVAGENRRAWGDCIYRAIKTGAFQGTPEEGQAKLRKIWLSSREAFQTFLERSGRGPFGDVARQSLKLVDDYLAGRAAPELRPLLPGETQ